MNNLKLTKMMAEIEALNFAEQLPDIILSQLS
jgi:hypothetical protein